MPCQYQCDTFSGNDMPAPHLNQTVNTTHAVATSVKGTAHADNNEANPFQQYSWDIWDARTLQKNSKATVNICKLHLSIARDYYNEHFSLRSKNVIELLNKRLDQAIKNGVIIQYKSMNHHTVLKILNEQRRSYPEMLRYYQAPYTIYLFPNCTNWDDLVLLCRDIEEILHTVPVGDSRYLSKSDLPLTDHIKFRQDRLAYGSTYCYAIPMTEAEIKNASKAIEASYAAIEYAQLVERMPKTLLDNAARFVVANPSTQTKLLAKLLQPETKMSEEKQQLAMSISSQRTILISLRQELQELEELEAQLSRAPTQAMTETTPPEEEEAPLAVNEEDLNALIEELSPFLNSSDDEQETRPQNIMGPRLFDVNAAKISQPKVTKAYDDSFRLARSQTK